MSVHRTRTAVIGAVGALTLLAAAACSSDTATGGTSSPAAAATSSAAGSATGSEGGGGSEAPAAGGAQLQLLFGSSGTAETDALTEAADAWGSENDSTVEVTAAQDLTQQLAQGFSSGTAPDVFYVGADQVANYAKAGNLLPYGDELSNADDFYPVLKDAFTYDGTFYCAPKDMSTLALFINTDLWAAAGLTDADIPTTWDQLATVAAKLNTGGAAGLSVAPERDRVDAFLVQNGSYLVAEDGTTITANDPKNAEALGFVKKMITDGVLKTPAELDSGWAGEAFGKGAAAMTIEGNWLLGALKSDYPDLKYTVAELPAGPTGTKGTLVFTNCWGISATTQFPEQAKSFVEYMTSTDQQMAFATAFGVIPSVESAQADYLSEFAANEPFVKGVDYARGVVNLPGITDVLADFNSQLQDLANADPQAILDSVQENLTAAVGG
ncbi:sugar ABC transporter substrate-binding protein [Nakamurella deserti]|uniref:sugar ABC transporter substrate-binding protein n=1 Tax=Nakamurella deserti TaxID=2164074 RepID=UPI000DBE8EB0|nr:extracellular solute-binding protein [Nakamurella deserti]